MASPQYFFPGTLEKDHAYTARKTKERALAGLLRNRVPGYVVGGDHYVPTIVGKAVDILLHRRRTGTSRSESAGTYAAIGALSSPQEPRAYMDRESGYKNTTNKSSTPRSGKSTPYESNVGSIMPAQGKTAGRDPRNTYRAPLQQLLVRTAEAAMMTPEILAGGVSIPDLGPNSFTSDRFGVLAPIPASLVKSAANLVLRSQASSVHGLPVTTISLSSPPPESSFSSPPLDAHSNIHLLALPLSTSTLLRSFISHSPSSSNSAITVWPYSADRAMDLSAGGNIVTEAAQVSDSVQDVENTNFRLQRAPAEDTENALIAEEARLQADLIFSTSPQSPQLQAQPGMAEASLSQEPLETFFGRQPDVTPVGKGLPDGTQESANNAVRSVEDHQQKLAAAQTAAQTQESGEALPVLLDANRLVSPTLSPAPESTASTREEPGVPTLEAQEPPDMARATRMSAQDAAPVALEEFHVDGKAKQPDVAERSTTGPGAQAGAEAAVLADAAAELQAAVAVPEIRPQTQIAVVPPIHVSASTNGENVPDIRQSTTRSEAIPAAAASMDTSKPPTFTSPTQPKLPEETSVHVHSLQDRLQSQHLAHKVRQGEDMPQPQQQQPAEPHVAQQHTSQRQSRGEAQVELQTPHQQQHSHESRQSLSVAPPQLQRSQQQPQQEQQKQSQQERQEQPHQQEEKRESIYQSPEEATVNQTPALPVKQKIHRNQQPCDRKEQLQQLSPHQASGQQQQQEGKNHVQGGYTDHQSCMILSYGNAQPRSDWHNEDGGEKPQQRDQQHALLQLREDHPDSRNPVEIVVEQGQDHTPQQKQKQQAKNAAASDTPVDRIMEQETEQPHGQQRDDNHQTAAGTMHTILIDEPQQQMPGLNHLENPRLMNYSRSFNAEVSIKPAAVPGGSESVADQPCLSCESLPNEKKNVPQSPMTPVSTAHISDKEEGVEGGPVAAAPAASAPSAAPEVAPDTAFSPQTDSASSALSSHSQVSAADPPSPQAPAGASTTLDAAATLPTESLSGGIPGLSPVLNDLVSTLRPSLAPTVSSNNGIPAPKPALAISSLRSTQQGTNLSSPACVGNACRSMTILAGDDRVQADANLPSNAGCTQSISVVSYNIPALRVLRSVCKNNIVECKKNFATGVAALLDFGRQREAQQAAAAVEAIGAANRGDPFKTTKVASAITAATRAASIASTRARVLVISAAPSGRNTEITYSIDDDGNLEAAKLLQQLWIEVNRCTANPSPPICKETQAGQLTSSLGVQVHLQKVHCQ